MRSPSISQTSQVQTIFGRNAITYTVRAGTFVTSWSRSFLSGSMGMKTFKTNLSVGRGARGATHFLNHYRKRREVVHRVSLPHLYTVGSCRLLCRFSAAGLMALL